ncbi:MAG: hypothetical protein VX460_12395, partial [Planctomycetota bacterium]|nr:hypothetical protein [Planctomycetota bacterium]
MRALARAARQAVQARAVCCGLGASLLTLALVIGAGHGLGDLEGVALAALVGALAGASWVAAVRVEEGSIARRLDRGLELDGALLAAYENAVGPARPLAELGAERIVDRECWSLARQQVVPHYAGFLAVPLTAAVVLLQTVAAADARGVRADLELRQMRGVASGVERALSAHAGALDEDELAALGAALAAARDASKDGDGAGDAMDAVSETLEDLAAELPAGSDAARELRELALRAEVLGVGSDADPGPGSPSPSDAGAAGEAGSARSAPEEGPGGPGGAQPTEVDPDRGSGDGSGAGGEARQGPQAADGADTAPGRPGGAGEPAGAAAPRAVPP